MIGSDRLGSDDHQAVTAALDAWTAAVRSGDLEAVLALSVPDEALLVVGLDPGERAHGPEGFRSMLRHLFASGGAYWWTWDHVQVRVSGDTGWVATAGTAHVARDGNDLTTPYRATAVFERRDGRWLLAHWHGSEPAEHGGGNQRAVVDPRPRDGSPAARRSSPIRVADFERLARDRVEPSALDYIAGGSWDEVTLRENEAAFARRRLLPRVLTDVSSIDPSVELLGGPVGLPVGLAPTAFGAFAHAEGECAAAAAAFRAGVVYCLSTLSSRSMEDVATANGDGPRWFQLYVSPDRGVTRALLARVGAAGYRAIVLTVDLPVPGYRERDIANRLRAPAEFGNLDVAGRQDLLAFLATFNDASLSWDDLAWIRSSTELPIAVKGILAPDDARLAVEHGAAAVWVSNHGGRQLDRAPAAIDMLEPVADAVAGRAEIYLDGGVRRGVDVLTALALGARAVFVGRPYLYALAYGGVEGVSSMLRLIRAELVAAMALLGVRRPADVSRAHLV